MNNANSANNANANTRLRLAERAAKYGSQVVGSGVIGSVANQQREQGNITIFAIGAGLALFVLFCGYQKPHNMAALSEAAPRRTIPEPTPSEIGPSNESITPEVAEGPDRV